MLLDSTRTLVEDVHAFNVEYKELLEKKKEGDESLFRGFEKSLNTIEEQIWKVAASSGSLISDAHVRLTPQQRGVAEHMNQTLVEYSQCM